MVVQYRGQMVLCPMNSYLATVRISPFFLSKIDHLVHKSGRYGSITRKDDSKFDFLVYLAIEQQDIIVSAMRKLEMSVAMNGSACVRFRPRQSTDQYYIVIYNGDGCSSYVSVFFLSS